MALGATVGLALLVSGLEMVGAVLVYTLLALIADPGRSDRPSIWSAISETASAGSKTRRCCCGVVSAMAVFFVIRSIAKIAAKYVQARVAHNAGVRLSADMFEGYLRGRTAGT
jgi:ATP-binding cassette, subfamily B, bacterial PglK